MRFGWTREADQCDPRTQAPTTHSLHTVLHTIIHKHTTPHTQPLSLAAAAALFPPNIGDIGNIGIPRPTGKESKDGLAFRFMQGASDRLSMGGGGATNQGRHCHSTRSLAAIDCHSFGVYTVTLLVLLSFSVRMTVSPRARVRKTPSWPRSWANFSLL